ncbi:organic cation/carnitine transporter 2-like [Dendrobium catenatum]|uniref:organic cation/carnitine transporter 2-like n=1 Tax=Dendrobium catenatum TaxID=906689 RepID=UPI0009F49F4C|nr:organic cation/carnitine transporter 2-like [Dendrobium catenatum]
MDKASSSPAPSTSEITGGHTIDISQYLNKGTVISSIDEVVERYMTAAAGNLLFPFLACLTLIFDSQQAFINVFSDKPPPWHCTSSTCDFSRPCNLPSNSSWSYSQPRKISTISDFSLECSSPIRFALPGSSFYVGCLAGGLSLGTLADSRLGRKKTLVLSTLIMSIAAALTTFSPNLAVPTSEPLLTSFPPNSSPGASASTSTLSPLFFPLQPGGLYSVARILWEKPWALQRLVVILIGSFGIGLMYHGMLLNLWNLNANLYISAALNAVAELPSALIIFFSSNVISRRRTLVQLTIVSGGCSLACAAMGGWSAVVFELVAFFGACTALYIERIYAVELFPTYVRNSAMALQRQAVVLGGVAAPAMVALGRRGKVLSFGMFGIVIIFCGLFIMFLPETRGRAISDTMEEEESKMMEGKIINN